MKRIFHSAVLLSALASLTGCGWFDFEEREPWRAEVEARCLASKVVTVSEYVQPMKAIEGPRVCGVDHPFHVTGLNGGSVGVSPRARLGCPMIPALEQWMRDTVQPAAQALYGVDVVEIKNMASYGCRSRNNQRGAPLSEHSFANALDVGAFRFADGREISVKAGWKGTPDEQMFLRQALAGSCKVFKTVLGPGSDAFHYDHFHLDLRLHDARGQRHVCKPVPAPDLPVAGMPLPQLAQFPIAAPPPQQQGIASETPVAASPLYGGTTPAMPAYPAPVMPQAQSYPPVPSSTSSVNGVSGVPSMEDDPFAHDTGITGSIKRGTGKK